MHFTRLKSDYTAPQIRTMGSRILAGVLGFVLLLAGGIVTSSPAHAGPNDLINVPDSVLRKGMNNALNQSPNDPITEAQAASITTLEPNFHPQEVITDLTGMEHLVNLEAVALEYHEISDLSPISELEKLERIVISNNRIVDLSPLQGLSNLNHLNVNNNRISDLSPISQLTGLQKLYVSRNHITDLTPLANLTNLHTITAREQFVQLPGKPVNTAVKSPLRDPGGQVVPVHSGDPGFLWFTASNSWSFSIVGWNKTLNWERNNIPIGAGASFSFTGEMHHDVTFTDVGQHHSFYDDIMWMNWAAITEGYEDGSFRPKNNITREAMAAFLYRASGEPTFAIPIPSPFSDVPTTHKFYREITWLRHAGITTGYDDGTFRPKNDITREAMAAFLYRTADPLIILPPGSPFSDVPLDHSFSTPIRWLKASGITGGYSDGTFRPKNKITREATSAFIHRMDNQGFFN